MKRFTIHCSVFLLVVGFVGLTSARAHAQGDQKHKQIELVSLPWGIAPGQTVCISVVVYASRPVGTNDPVIARIQLLDTEGEVIAQSDEMEVAPGKIRFWNVPRELLPAGEPRIQVRGRTFVTFPSTRPFDVNRDRPPLALTVELIDPVTGRTGGVYTWAYLLRRPR